MTEDNQYWVSPDFGFYQGTETEGARVATQAEIDAKLNPKPDIITPVVDQDIADMYQAMFDMSTRLEKLEGGK